MHEAGGEAQHERGREAVHPERKARPFSTAPATALHSMRMRGDTISGRLRARGEGCDDEPACTAMVSPARPRRRAAISRESEGRTAAALNHSTTRQARRGKEEEAPASAQGRDRHAYLVSVYPRARAGVVGALGCC